MDRLFVKKFLLMSSLLALSAMNTLPRSAHATGAVDGVVAIVNGDVITQSDLEQAMAMQAAQMGGVDKIPQVYAMRTQIVEHMVDEHLLQQEMKRAHMDPTEEELDAAVQQFLSQRHLSMEQLTQGLAQQGLPFDLFRKNLGMQLAQQRFIQEEIAKKVQLSDDDVHHLYRQSQGKRAATANVHLAQIVVPVPESASASELRALERKAESLAKRAQSGDFLAIAKSQNATGDVGMIDPATLPPQVASVLPRLSINDVSEAIPTRDGFYIVKLLERKSTTDTNFAKLKPQLEQALYARKMQGAMERYLANLRAKAYIELKENAMSAVAVRLPTMPRGAAGPHRAPAHAPNAPLPEEYDAGQSMGLPAH